MALQVVSGDLRGSDYEGVETFDPRKGCLVLQLVRVENLIVNPFTADEIDEPAEEQVFEPMKPSIESFSPSPNPV